MMNDVYQKLRSEGEYVPGFLIKLWQMRIKERFGLEVDSDITEVIVKTLHEGSTWKLSRAEKYIIALLRSKGASKKEAGKEARKLILTIMEPR